MGTGRNAISTTGDQLFRAHLHSYQTLSNWISYKLSLLGRV